MKSENLSGGLTLAGCKVPTKLLSCSSSSAGEGENEMENLWVNIKAIMQGLYVKDTENKKTILYFPLSANVQPPAGK